ncbi:hypothetical protein V490_01317 [Pseudogymnoascus sp. VKM F-3557]|nr:hypothetical protein V490_01317 [Pseudogymnoascus sp. VKM F-3557]
MRSFAAPLGHGLIAASFMASQIGLATAACTNTTAYVMDSIQTNADEGATTGGPTLVTQLDFISCPSSRNVSCTLPAQNYTVTITPLFNVSTSNVTLSQGWEDSQSINSAANFLYLPLNSSDRTAIIEYNQGLWNHNNPDHPWHLSVEPFTVTYSSANISSSVNLTVEPGYNMTLTYKPFRAGTWVRYENCDDESLDGKLIGALFPYYVRNSKEYEGLRISGTFFANKQFLNDTVAVPEDKDGGGVGLKAGSGWATTLIMVGVLTFNWL